MQDTIYVRVLPRSNSSVGRVTIVASNGNKTNGSAIATNLKCTLSHLGKHILLVSTSTNLHDLSLVLNITNGAVCSLTSMFTNGYRPIQTVCPSPMFRGIFILPTPVLVRSVYATRRVQDLYRNLATCCSRVVVSYPTNLNHKFRATITTTSHTLIISAPSVIYTQSTRVVTHLLRRQNVPSRLIVGHLHPSGIVSNSVPSISRIVSATNVRLLNVVPRSRRITITGTGNHPLPTSYRTTIYFTGLTTHCVKRDIPLTRLRGV